jgi:hypothetical protein
LWSIFFEREYNNIFDQTVIKLHNATDLSYTSLCSHLKFLTNVGSAPADSCSVQQGINKHLPESSLNSVLHMLESPNYQVYYFYNTTPHSHWASFESVFKHDRSNSGLLLLANKHLY